METGGYTDGNVIHLHFSDNMSKEAVTDIFQKIMTVPTQIDQSYPIYNFKQDKQRQVKRDQKKHSNKSQVFWKK